MNDSRIHNVSCLLADALMQVLRPYVETSDFARTWFRVYWAVRAGVEAYEIQSDNPEPRLVPTNN
jgi:hypothetical protein